MSFGSIPTLRTSRALQVCLLYWEEDLWSLGGVVAKMALAGVYLARCLTSMPTRWIASFGSTPTPQALRALQVCLLYWAGGFVVTWDSYGQDGSSWGVFGQVFDANGNKLGNEFRVNTYTLNSQYSPSVASLSGGGFVVTWHSNGQDGSSWGVFGQMFNTNANKVINEFRVNTYTSGRADLSQVWRPYPMEDLWSLGISNGQDGSNYGVYGQVFDANGNKLGNEFQVNTYTSGEQSAPSVASLSGGGFVVTWNSWAQDGYVVGCVWPGV